MYTSSAIKNEIIDAAREMLDKLCPKTESDINNGPDTSSNQPASATTSRRVSQAMLMFQVDDSNMQVEEEDEVQRYINFQVKNMDEDLLEWYVAIEVGYGLS